MRRRHAEIAITPAYEPRGADFAEPSRASFAGIVDWETIRPAAKIGLRSKSEMIGQPPAGLKRYFEWLSRGKRTGRVAYVLKEWDLPKTGPGAEWAIDSKFNAAQELLRNPALKEVFKAAIDKGVAVVNGPEE